MPESEQEAEHEHKARPLGLLETSNKIQRTFCFELLLGIPPKLIFGSLCTFEVKKILTDSKSSQLLQGEAASGSAETRTPAKKRKKDEEEAEEFPILPVRGMKTWLLIT